MALVPTVTEPVAAAAPVISLVPTTPEEVAEIGTQLAALNSPIVGHTSNGVELLVSSYAWNLTYDFNLNWRVAVGSPATGHKPSCASRDLVTVWTPPS